MKMDWRDTVINHARGMAYKDSEPGDRCEICYSFKRKGRVYIEDHCKDTTSPFPDQHVEPNWWCVRFSRRKQV
jgi:ribosomal protein L36